MIIHLDNKIETNEFDLNKEMIDLMKDKFNL